MTSDREEHLEAILSRMVPQLRAKYIAGQQEHGGCLEIKGMINAITQASGEISDQICYNDVALQNAIELREIALEFVSRGECIELAFIVLRKLNGEVQES